MYISIITTILISLSCPQSEKGSSCDTGRDHLFPEGENNELQIECIKYTINKRTCKSDKNTHHSQTGLNRYESKIYHRRLRYTPALLFTMMAVTRVIPRPLLVTVLAAAGVVSVLTLAWRFVWRLVWGLVWWLVWRFVWRFVGWSVLAGGENRLMSIVSSHQWHKMFHFIKQNLKSLQLINIHTHHALKICVCWKNKKCHIKYSPWLSCYLYPI